METLWEYAFIIPLGNSHINLTEMYWILAIIVSHSRRGLPKS